LKPCGHSHSFGRWPEGASGRRGYTAWTQSPIRMGTRAASEQQPRESRSSASETRWNSRHPAVGGKCPAGRLPYLPGFSTFRFDLIEAQQEAVKAQVWTGVGELGEGSPNALPGKWKRWLFGNLSWKIYCVQRSRSPCVPILGSVIDPMVGGAFLPALRVKDWATSSPALVQLLDQYPDTCPRSGLTLSNLLHFF
jgi:hypothetical protein